MPHEGWSSTARIVEVVWQAKVTRLEDCSRGLTNDFNISSLRSIYTVLYERNSDCLSPVVAYGCFHIVDDRWGRANYTKTKYVINKSISTRIYVKIMSSLLSNRGQTVLRARVADGVIRSS